MTTPTKVRLLSWTLVGVTAAIMIFSTMIAVRCNAIFYWFGMDIVILTRCA